MSAVNHLVESDAEKALRAKLSNQELADINKRKVDVRDSNRAYIDEHPEIRTLLNDFMTAILLAKPEDVFDFAKRHFSHEDDPICKDRIYRPLVVCGPSGVGKGTLITRLFQDYPDHFGFSVSHTTRGPRPGEVHGIHYNFTTKEAMTGAIEEGKFLEYANVHTNIYGTSYDAVRKVQRAGKICVLDIDVQGVQKIKKTTVTPYYIFIAPPSMDHLIKRLVGRGTESEKDIKTRIGNAQAEVEYGTTEGNFDKVVVNDDLDSAYAELKDYLHGLYPHLAAKPS